MDEDITDINLRNMVNAVAVASENIYNANQVEQPESSQSPAIELKWSQDEDNFDSEMQELIPTATQIDNSFDEASFEGNEEVVETSECTVSQFVKTDLSTSATDNSETILEATDNIEATPEATDSFETTLEATNSIETGPEATDSIETTLEATNSIETGPEAADSIDIKLQPTDNTVQEQTCTNEKSNVDDETIVLEVHINSNADEVTNDKDVTENNSENAEEKKEEKVELRSSVPKKEATDDVVIIENDTEKKVKINPSSKRKSKLRTPVPPKKKVIDCSKKCRICMNDNPTISLFKSRDPVPGSEKMLACSAIQITEDDGLPQFICRKCDTNLNIAYQLKILCEKSDLMFREMLGVKNKTIVKRELVLLDCNEISDSSEDMSIAKYKSKANKSTRGSDGDYSPPTSKKGRKKDTEKIPALLANKAIKLNHVAQAAIMTPKYVCKACNKVFVRVETYNNHLETHKVNRYKCPTCDESFKTEKAQHIHTKMAHAILPKILYKCSLCDKEYELMRHLKIHEATHNREKKYKCEICSGVFPTLVGLTQHKKEKHPIDARSFQCKTCGLRFRSEDALKRHTQIAHNAKSEEKKPVSTRDLFKSIAPLTSTYWSDSYSD